MLDLEIKDGIARITMNRAPLNALNPELISQMRKTLADLAKSRDCRALMIDSGIDSFFSNGLDPEAMLALDVPGRADVFRSFLSLARDLYSFPAPTLSAIAGHAMAGGAVIGIATDFRLLAEGKYSYCFSEVKVGLTIPEFLLEMISQVTGPHHLRSLAMLAERFRPEECLAMGLADKIVPRENLLIESRKYLLSLSDRPLSSMRSVKENMHAGTLARIDRFLESQEDTFFQFLGANFEEGLKAVLERRRPQFTD